MENITYTKQGDYYLPDLALPEQKIYTLGKYGRLRLNYLKKHRKIVYTNFLTTGTLNDHLAYVDEQANNLLKYLMSKLSKSQGISEELKARDQMAWVGAMNNIKHQAEEFIYAELCC